MPDAPGRPGSGSAATRVLRASSASDRAVISSNQKQKAGCFGTCLCMLALVGPMLIILSITYLLQEQIDHGREAKVQRYNDAARVWAEGGESELLASSFQLLSEVDAGQPQQMELRAELVPLDDKYGDLPTPPAAPLHVKYDGSNPPLLFQRAYDASHRSVVAINAQFGGATTSRLALDFPTFKEVRYKASKVACDSAHGHWAGDPGDPISGWCRGRVAASAVCAVIERDRGTGAWRFVLDGSAGVHRPGCGVSYAPAPLFEPMHRQSFSRLQIVLRHVDSPYLVAAAEGISQTSSGAVSDIYDTFQGNAPPWHFGKPSKFPRQQSQPACRDSHNHRASVGDVVSAACAAQVQCTAPLTQCPRCSCLAVDC